MEDFRPPQRMFLTKAKDRRGTDLAALKVAAAVGLFMSLLYAISANGFLVDLDDQWLDAMFRLRGMEAGDPRLTMVAIDDAALERYGNKAEYLLLKDDGLFQYGVKTVAHKNLFLAPGDPERDRVLVAAGRKWKDRLVFATAADPEVRDRFAFRPLFPELHATGVGVGAINQPFVSADGALRQTSLVIGTSVSDPASWPGDPRRMPTLALKAAAAFEGKNPDDYLKRGNFFNINFRGGDFSLASRMAKVENPGIRRISAARVLGGGLTKQEREALKGGLVLIGDTAIGQGQNYPNPFASRVSGLRIVAAITDNALNGRFLRIPPRWVTVAVILLAAFACLPAARWGPLLFAGTAGVETAGWVFLTYLLFKARIVFPVAEPGLALAITFLILFVRMTVYERRSKSRIRRVFGQFVAPEVVDDLLSSKSGVELGGELRDMTVAFFNIANFTRIAERLGPQATITFLNRYLAAMSGVIHKRKGVIDKYMGDGIMAFWNAPLAQADHSALALLAAAEAREAMEALNAALGKDFPTPPRMRIGVCSGPMTVGLTGSDFKMQYTVIGDAVNQASRLESANSFFGSEILVNEACWSQGSGSVASRELGKIRVAGRDEPVHVYEILGKKGELAKEWKRALPDYERALKLFKEGERKPAEAFFRKVLEAVPDDLPSKRYLEVLDGGAGTKDHEFSFAL